MNFCGECGIMYESSYRSCQNCRFLNKSQCSKETHKISPLNSSFNPCDTDIYLHRKHFEYKNTIKQISKFIGLSIFIGCFFIISSAVYRLIETSILFSLNVGLSATTLLFFIFLNVGLYQKIAYKIYKSNYIFSGWTLYEVYKTFESAQLNNGEYRCIYCGNSRVYRTGIYTFNHCTVNCTKCKAFLYYD